MKIAYLLILLCLFLTTKSQTTRLKEKVDPEVTRVMPRVIEWRRDFHQHPELGNREVRTAKIIADHLRALGMEVSTGVAKTGVVGILKGGKPGPVIALRADMDGLPVKERVDLPYASKQTTVYNGQEVSVMHACGHDTHMAILMGAAEVLVAMKKDIPGTIKFIFQPAEEGPPPGEDGGAELMVKEGVLENPRVEAVFGLHIWSHLEVGKIEYRPGGVMASVNDMKIIVKGKQAHGAYPWLSVDPVVVSAQIINNLQTVVSRNLEIIRNAGVVTIGAIHGGNRANIIPETVEMLGTIRAFSDGDEEMIIRRVKEVVHKTAESAGASAEILLPHTTHYPVTFNDSALTAKMLPTLQRTAGKENVRLCYPVTGAEDFAFYQRERPGLFIFLGGMPKGKKRAEAPAHHTPEFFVDESGLPLGVRTMCNLALDYLTSPAR